METISSLITQIIENKVTLTLVFLLLLSLIGALIYVSVLGNRVSRRRIRILDQFATILERKVSGPELERSISNLEVGERDELVRVAIDEYGETLVFRESRTGIVLRNVLDANYYFSAERIVPELVRNRFLSATPGFLTAFGLIATFLGLSLGLSGINLDGDTEVLKSGVSGLVAGAGIAFVPSLVGVFGSVVLNIATKAFQGRVDTAFRKVENRIDRAVERVTAEQLLSESLEKQEALLRVQEDVSQVTKELAEKIGSQVGESVAASVEKLSIEMRAAISDSLQPALEALTQSIVTQNSQVFDELTRRMGDGFAEIGREQARELHGGASAIQEAVQSLAEGIAGIQNETAQLQSITQSQAENMSAASDSVATAALALEGSASKFDGVSTQIRQLQDLTTSKFEELLEQHTGIFANLEGYTLTLPKLQADLRDLVQGMSDASTRVATSNETASQTLTTVTNATLAELKTELQNHQSNSRVVYESLERNLKAATAQMEAWLRDYSHQVESQTNQRMDTWNKHTTDFATHLLNVSTTLQSVILELQAQQDSIEATLTRTDQNAESLDKTFTQLADGIGRFYETTPALHGLTRSVEQLVGRLNTSNPLEQRAFQPEQIAAGAIPVHGTVPVGDSNFPVVNRLAAEPTSAPDEVAGA